MSYTNYNIVVTQKKEVRKITTPKKIGRPKEENPKNHDIKVRLDEKKYESLMRYCTKNNMKRSEAIRKGVDLLLETDKKK
ncbi:CopG family transcriptional regulator [Clostridium perfringens]|uniref:CopG family transcriptional regulator n=1 Tax=Clostridium perfringens TaxID=1502 RepID=UPI00321980F8